jgi:hypothetical protein
VPESLLEVEGLASPSPSPSHHAWLPETSLFAVLFPFNRCGHLFHPLGCFAYFLFLFSLLEQVWCEAQWDGDSANSRRLHVHILDSFFSSFVAKPRLEFRWQEERVAFVQTRRSKAAQKEGTICIHESKEHKMETSHSRPFFFLFCGFVLLYNTL